MNLFMLSAVQYGQIFGMNANSDLLTILPHLHGTKETVEDFIGREWLFALVSESWCNEFWLSIYFPARVFDGRRCADIILYLLCYKQGREPRITAYLGSYRTGSRIPVLAMSLCSTCKDRVVSSWYICHSASLIVSTRCLFVSKQGACGMYFCNA